MSKVIINNMRLLGARLRKSRKSHNVKHAVIAKQAGVGLRFISELENGKPTVEMGKVLCAIDALGLELVLQPKADLPEVGRAFGDTQFKILGQSSEQ